MANQILPINHEYSVHSGVFAGVDDRIYMELNENGEYLYKSKSPINEQLLRRFNSVDIMSDYSDNEDVLARKLFSNIKSVKYDKTIGYYLDLYAGYVKESNFREKASSGGFGTWLLCELLRLGEIDGVIHPHAVDPGKNKGVLFKYRISKTEKEVRRGAKTSYYPMELSEVLKEVKGNPGKYAVVAISDFVTELRLLCEQNRVFRERIVYMIGLFNAHQKSTQYAEALAWKEGILPGDLESIDFRVKTKRSAGDYDYTVKGRKGKESITITKRMSDTTLSQWHLGFFKSKFSDFTDNAFNELADITLGDAWLPKYDKDPKGTNILVVRNPKLSKIIKNAVNENRVNLDVLSEKDIISSQGMTQHIINDLPYRLYSNRKHSKFTPKKRLLPSKKITSTRRRIQDLRNTIVHTNPAVYQEARRSNNYGIYDRFTFKMHQTSNYIYASGDQSTFFRKVERCLTVIKTKVRIRTRLRQLRHRLRISTRLRQVQSKVINSKIDGVIISLTSLFNYGNIIQRYALLRVLQINGYNFEPIMMPNYMDTSDKTIFGAMDSFVKRYICPKAYEDAKQYNYRNYIVGSDQVWRNWYGDDWKTFAPYFLDFVESDTSNKIAYGASFGVDTLAQAGINRGNQKKIKSLMRDFAHISVREPTGVSLVEQITGSTHTADVVLDPTLLLEAKDYSKLVGDSDISDSKRYRVFCYILDQSKEKQKFIQNTSKHFNNDCYILNPDVNKPYESVEFWLKGFRDADIVITDSFHGTVFAIINNKDFLIFSNHLRGNARFIGLLDSLGVGKDRLIDEENIGLFEIKKLEPINWTSVNRRLTELRTNSINWLISAIRNKK